jgi:opacity protein-like surface antigen
MKTKAIALVALASMCFLGGSALAADLPMKAPAYKTPALVPYVFNWAGFYGGGQVGYGWSSTSTDVYSIATGNLLSIGGVDRDGIFGGGQIGFNFMVTPNWLLGVEGDLSAADLSGSSTGCNFAGTGCAHSDSKVDWFGTLRGRVGYAVNNWLIYATGGAVWTHSSITRTIVQSTNPAVVGLAASSSGTHSGWTVGGGVEWGFAPHWTAKLEYLYLNVDATNDYYYTGFPLAARHSVSSTDTSTVRLGVNYLFNWGG